MGHDPVDERAVARSDERGVAGVVGQRRQGSAVPLEPARDDLGLGAPDALARALGEAAVVVARELPGHELRAALEPEPDRDEREQQQPDEALSAAARGRQRPAHDFDAHALQGVWLSLGKGSAIVVWGVLRRTSQPRALTARGQSGENRELMRYLTTLEVARELNVSKQTLLNWLYAKKVPEPPRNKNGYRLWSTARVSLVRQLIREGRLHQRTVIHREPVDDPVVLLEVAREVSQFLKDAQIPLRRFVRELNQVHARARPKAAVKKRRRASEPGAGSAPPEPADYSQGMSGISRRSIGGPPSACASQIGSRSAAWTPAYQTLSGWIAIAGPRLQCFRQ